MESSCSKARQRKRSRSASSLASRLLATGDAYESVLDYAGSFWWNRDTHDARVINQVRMQTGSIIDHLEIRRKGVNPMLAEGLAWRGPDPVTATMKGGVTGVEYKVDDVDNAQVIGHEMMKVEKYLGHWMSKSPACFQ